jgi:very-short-patch-repair endonuclease
VPAGFHHRSIPKRTRSNARQMRHAATDAEAATWRLLRHRRLVGFKFRRQVPLEGFILDFVCFDREIVIEVDGSQHFSSQRDQTRDSKLDREGFRVLGYWNNDVLQRPTTVLEDIFEHLTKDQH